MDKIVVLMPAYNEALRIENVVRGVLALAIPDAAVQVLVVDDGSRDNTVAVAETAGARVLALGTNVGAGTAMARGFELARAEGADYLVHIDSDGQLDPAQIPSLLAPVREGRADLAVGTRFLGKAPAYLGIWKSFVLKLVARLVGMIAGARLTDLSCGIRCMNRRALAETRPSFSYDYIQQTLIQVLAAGLRVVEVPVVAVSEEGPVARGLSSHFMRYSTNYLRILGYSLAGFFSRRVRDLFRG